MCRGAVQPQRPISATRHTSGGLRRVRRLVVNPARGRALLLPGLCQKYERAFGERYHCAANNADRLAKVFYEQCERYSISPRIIPYEPQVAMQLSLL